MNTARLNQGTPLLLNGVTKRYGENTILNALDLHIPAGPGSLWPLSGAAAAARVRCCAFWPDWNPPTAATFWQGQRRWPLFRTIPA